jgi:hypothetical protein
VVTSKAGAYYALVSRLRRAELSFESVLPGSDHRGCEIILTTKDEAAAFGQRALTLEELDDDPGIFKGQVLSKLDEKREVVFVGIDPGIRTGLAVYYGPIPLSFGTFGSPWVLCSKIGAFARGLAEGRFVVRIGDGNPRMAEELAAMLKEVVPDAAIEIVDEKGTSGRTPKMKGLQGDQRAASRIAFRKGEVVNPGKTRTLG